MEELCFFNTGCRVGLDPKGMGETPESLQAEMKRLGVGKALVSDYALGPFGAVLSNQRVAGWVKQPGMENLYGVWCMLPEQCDELPPPEKFFGTMAENRIAAVMMDPFNHRYVACRMTLGKYMDEARHRNVPVLLNAYAGKWNELYAFLAEFPDNLYILSAYRGKWGPDRQLRPLLENYPGLYCGIGGYWLPGGIGDLVEKYGAGRFLFSSVFPEYTAGSAMLHLKHSGLDDKTLRAIAGGNMENILKGELL